jgi:6-phosphogluconolactonase
MEKLAGPAGVPDLVYLGLGEDGHIASLFPGSAGLRAAAGLVLPARAPAGVKPATRLTLSLAALNAAPTVVLMALGRAKKAVFARAAAGDAALPAGRLCPRGALYLLYSDNSPARQRPARREK